MTEEKLFKTPPLLCTVVNAEIFNALSQCYKYSERFLYDRMWVYYRHGINAKAEHPIADLYRQFRKYEISLTVMQYILAGYYVFASHMKPGTFVANTKPFSVISPSKGSKKVTQTK